MTTLEAAYKSLRVLVIDDDDEMRKLIGRMLERLGVTTIIHANDGASGFREAVNAQPDVALCDVHMAPVDGHEFLRQVRDSEIERVRTLPVIFLSGDNLLATVQRATRHHVDAYMVKPMSRDELKTQLDIIITRLAERGNQQSGG
jgi:two-component system, chemotaxis family, chemotaxis protein CheY